MLKNSFYVWSVIATLALLTFALRALPFVAVQWLGKHEVVQRIGRFLPLVIMVLLLLHTAMGLAAQTDYITTIWQVLALMLAILLQYRFGVVLLSVGVSSLLYVTVCNFV